MPLPSPALTWTSLTEVVNLAKTPGNFLGKLISIDAQTIPTETVEIGTLRGERTMAPFVRRGSEALMVGGLGEEMYVVQAPNIRIKRPFNAAEMFDNQRRVGTPVFPTGGEVVSATDRVIARDLTNMIYMVENAEEWMLAQALRGSISYSQLDEEVFTITFARSGSNVVTPSIFWDQANNTPIQDVRAILRIVSEVNGGGITDVVLGSEASATFLSNATVLATIKTDTNLNAGSLDLSQQFRQDGAIFLGRWMGLNWWEYARTVTINGAATALIRAKYAEFISTSRNAGWKKKFASIPDFDAFLGGSMELQRFSKSWVEKDPSALMALLHTRPLVIPTNPDTTVSFKMVSG